MASSSFLKNLTTHIQSLLEKKLWLQVLVAMGLGIGVGVLLGPAGGLLEPETTQAIGSWLALPGTLFLKLVQMIMIPLIFASIIGGLAGSDSRDRLRKMGFNVLIYFVSTTALAITIGLGVAHLVNPGLYFGGDVPATENIDNVAPQLPNLAEIPMHIGNLLPDNPLTSMVSGEMLSIVIFTIIIGVALSSLKPKTAEPILNLLNSVQEVCMIVVKWAMKLVPIAVFGLMAQLSSSMGMSSLMGIGMYVLCVLGGLLILLVVYLLLVKFLARRPVGPFLRAIRDPQLLAFSTTSSAAVMPLSLQTAEDKLKVSPSVSNFLIPIGTTINMDGTALYQCISAVFIAQVYGIDLNFTSLLLLVITIVAASIGTPSIPGGGVIVMAAVLQGLDIPAEGLMLIIGMDRILGMFRTTLNVTGDLTACVVFDQLWSKGQTSP